MVGRKPTPPRRFSEEFPVPIYQTNLRANWITRPPFAPWIAPNDLVMLLVPELIRLVAEAQSQRQPGSGFPGVLEEEAWQHGYGIPVAEPEISIEIRIDPQQEVCQRVARTGSVKCKARLADLSLDKGRV